MIRLWNTADTVFNKRSVHDPKEVLEIAPYFVKRLFKNIFKSRFYIKITSFFINLSLVYRIRLIYNKLGEIIK